MNNDMPIAPQPTTPDDELIKTYRVNNREIVARITFRQSMWPVDVKIEMKYGPTVAHGDLIQRFLTLVAKKISVRLDRNLPVMINAFRLPSYDEFLNGHTGDVTNDLGTVYAECRGLASAVLWMFSANFPIAFRE